jgi:hypothetical protein
MCLTHHSRMTPLFPGCTVWACCLTAYLSSSSDKGENKHTYLAGSPDGLTKMAHVKLLAKFLVAYQCGPHTYPFLTTPVHPSHHLGH